MRALTVILCAAVPAMFLAGCKGDAARKETPPPASQQVTAPPPAAPAPKAEAPKPPPPPKETPRAPGLVGHWKFDEKEGDAAVDSSGSGNDGKLVGGPRRVAGKIGGALEFDGNDDVVEIPNSVTLENLQEGGYTIAAWVRPVDTPPGQESNNKAHYGIVNKAGWHTGLRYGNDNKFVFEHWIQTDKPDEPQWSGTGTWDDTYDPGKWYHVVGVVDAAAGTATIFVNGESKNTSEAWDTKAKAREYGQTPWRIGYACPGAQEWAWPAKAAIDDVRLYNRALKDAEVEALYKAGAAGQDK